MHAAVIKAGKFIPGGSLALEAVPNAGEEKKTRKKGIQIRGGRGTRKGCQNGEKGIEIAMIRILARRSNVERVGNVKGIF